ncbi:hypothetical protein ONE63_001492 [Megalurothrips usitatus]|uniref:RING-type E3 ubiquitin transferase n=1 Tax=Megalurothrips usitatus TaxID=439358 RepID=A0AAV7XGN2_9NEOP|nr:hypothetical protein ONE63_001492 [Megalurothrips usitatus]
MPQYLTMYPASPLPQHITALYMIAVMSSIALFGQSITIVGADILVYCEDPYVDVEMEFRDVPSRFGDSLPLQGLEGYLVYADPPLACGPVAPPPHVANISRPWILLISRGNCSYENKVRHAQASNYQAVIVHNVNSSDLEPMSATNSTGIYIPSVFVGEHTGTFLRTKYLYNEINPCRHYILINDDMPFNINTHLLLPFATVVGICCVIMFTFMMLKCFQDRRRQRRHRLPAASLRQIPTSKFMKGHPYETCAICLEDYQEGEKLRILPCSHAYHSKCIDPWLTRNRRVCPVCKRKVFAQDERVSDSDSDSDADDTTPLVRPGSQGTQGGTFDSPTVSFSCHSLVLASLFRSSDYAASSSSSSVSSGPELDRNQLLNVARRLRDSLNDWHVPTLPSEGNASPGSSSNAAGREAEVTRIRCNDPAFRDAVIAHRQRVIASLFGDNEASNDGDMPSVPTEGETSSGSANRLQGKSCALWCRSSHLGTFS